jgi:integrase
LRRGELTALRWEDVDLAQGVIKVRRGWDHVEGEIAPKSREGRRNVPIPAPLRDVLLEHRMSTPERVRVFRSASWVNVAVKRARKTFTDAKLTPSICIPAGTRARRSSSLPA